MFGSCLVCDKVEMQLTSFGDLMPFTYVLDRFTSATSTLVSVFNSRMASNRKDLRFKAATYTGFALFTAIVQDFLLIILRELLKRRKSLKLVLMSATLNAEAFSSYFGGCAIVSIPGRAFPVKEYRLEDILHLTEYEVQEGSEYALKDSDQRRFSKSALRKMYYPRYTTKVIHSLSIVNENVINYELLAALLEKIAQNEGDGAILVFLPGMSCDLLCRLTLLIVLCSHSDLHIQQSSATVQV
jgi:hypothetical protein